MLIEIHAIQNHSPSNLNRDDLGAPKTCYFGGVLRSRISSQCLKRSIRMSDEFKELLGGIRTRRLAELIAKEVDAEGKEQKRIEKILEKCGIKATESQSKKKESDDESVESDTKKDSKMLVYTTHEAIREMAQFLKSDDEYSEDELANEFGRLIAEKTTVPDMALSGRMLEPGKAGKKIWQNLNTTVEASLQVAHAISTHEARPEVDYFVAADDIPGDDAGAGYLDETMFNSACFYKYFSINWEQLLKNLHGNINLAVHTVGAFIRGAAISNPTGKQNSFASHNLPDGILIELKKTPVSYANAFAEPVSRNNGRGIIEQSIAQLNQYAIDIDAGFGKPDARFWFSPNLRHKLSENTDSSSDDYASLEELTSSVVNTLSRKLGIDVSWQEAKASTIDEIDRLNSLVQR